jgi:membrane fusion protein (multidrug efflux system)
MFDSILTPARPIARPAEAADGAGEWDPVRRGRGAGRLAVLLALVLAGCGARGGGPPQMGPPDVSVIVLQTQPVTLKTELPGRVTPYAVAEVRPQVGGLVQARLFTEGSEVKAGQALYQIDPASYRAAYDQAHAQLESAEASQAGIKAKADREAGLIGQDAISRQEFDDTRAAARQAAAAVAQARAALETARINLDHTRVGAPIAGRIGRSSVTQGALVTADQTTALATIQRLDPVYVDITQSASEQLRLRRGLGGGAVGRGGPASAVVRLKLEDGGEYPLDGTLQFTDITVDQATGAVAIRAVFPNPDGVLLPGMYVRAVITEGVEAQGLLVPQQAVSRDQTGQPTAWIVDEQGKARLRTLRTDRAVGDKWLVTDGLKPGDTLIVEGLQRVQPGAAVHRVAFGGGPDPAIQPAVAPPPQSAVAAPPPRLRQMAAPAPSSAPAAPVAGNGGAMAQVGAFASAALARRSLDEDAAAAPEAMAGRTPTVEAGRLHGRSVYRAFVGGFGSRADAAGFCAALQARRRDCFVR